MGSTFVAVVADAVAALVGVRAAFRTSKVDSKRWRMGHRLVLGGLDES